VARQLSLICAVIRCARRDHRALPGSSAMVLSIHPAAAPLIALIAGILILLVPRVLNYVIAIYLILIGLLGLMGGHF
jgi:hypothetical protein